MSATEPGVPEDEAAEETVGFQGFRRDDGSVGVRNRVLVLPSVICSHEVADRIAAELPEAVSAPHDHGCAQLGADNDQTERTFLGVATNPNVAGTVVIGLGCEEIQSDEVAAGLEERGAQVREVAIQDVGGTDACIDHGIDHARDLVEVARSSARDSADLGDLAVGIASSDLRDSTVETADPLVGDFARSVVEAGGRVVVAGIERLSAHPEEAVGSASAECADALDGVLADRRDMPSRARRVFGEAKRRSFEEVSRSWGGLPIQDVIEYGERATHEGVTVLDAPSAFEEAATGLAAAGAQVVVHATADGIPAGHPIVPVVKVSGDRDTLAALPEDVDVDATAATAGDLRRTVLAVADGEPSCAERHGLTEFAITRVGPSM